MTSRELTNMIRAEPFHAFSVCLADGRHLPVKHPEFIAHAPNSRTLVWVDSDGEFEVVDLMLVTSLSTRNGKTPKRKAD